MSLTSILNEMELNRGPAEMDVSMGSPETYGGRIGLKRASIEAMKRLTLQYRNELMASTVFIVVTGPGRNSFTELASGDSFGCFSTDPDEFYKDLASRIDPSLFGREGVNNLFNIAGNILEDKALELDINSYNAIRFSEKYNRGVKTVEDFIPVIRDAINDQVGPEIVGINAIASIVTKAVAKRHSAAITPLILNTSDENFALSLFRSLSELVPKGTLTDSQHASKKKAKSFLVVAGKASKSLASAEGVIVVKNVSEESVGQALETVRNNIL